MNLNNARILICAQFAAPYPGNFIASIANLANQLENCYKAKIACVFPSGILKQDWSERFIATHKVYLTGNDKLLISRAEALTILDDFNPDLIYTHFEGYDLPIHRAVKHSRRKIRQVWHMRDTLTFQRHPIKALYQVYCYFRHYGLPMFGDEVMRPNLIANCSDELNFVRKYRFSNKIKEQVIPNGIDLNRVQKNMCTHEKYTFLAYGGRNVQKRIDNLLRAGEILANEGYTFHIIITKGTDTESVVHEYFNENIPEWLVLTEQVSDVNDFFKKGDCFIVTSVYETFCNAIIEATLAGLPVLRTDIKGTKWSKDIPGIYSFPGGDPLAMAQSMKQIMKVPLKKIKEDHCLAKKHFEKEYSMDIWTNRIMDFFKGIS